MGACLHRNSASCDLSGVPVNDTVDVCPASKSTLSREAYAEVQALSMTLSAAGP